MDAELGCELQKGIVGIVVDSFSLFVHETALHLSAELFLLFNLD